MGFVWNFLEIPVFSIQNSCTSSSTQDCADPFGMEASSVACAAALCFAFASTSRFACSAAFPAGSLFTVYQCTTVGKRVGLAVGVVGAGVLAARVGTCDGAVGEGVGNCVGITDAVVGACVGESLVCVGNGVGASVSDHEPPNATTGFMCLSPSEGDWPIRLP